MKQKANRLSFDNYIRPTLLRVALFSLSLLLLSAIGCDNPTVYKIGVSQCSADDWRTKMNDEINRETMLHDDVVVEIRSADDSNARQIEDLCRETKTGNNLISCEVFMTRAGLISQTATNVIRS